MSVYKTKPNQMLFFKSIQQIYRCLVHFHVVFYQGSKNKHLVDLCFFFHQTIFQCHNKDLFDGLSLPPDSDICSLDSTKNDTP